MGAAIGIASWSASDQTTAAVRTGVRTAAALFADNQARIRSRWMISFMISLVPP